MALEDASAATVALSQPANGYPRTWAAAHVGMHESEVDPIFRTTQIFTI
jgi:hypothetical protein